MLLRRIAAVLLRFNLLNVVVVESNSYKYHIHFSLSLFSVCWPIACYVTYVLPFYFSVAISGLSALVIV